MPDINLSVENSIQFDPATIPNGDLFSFLGFDASALANLDPVVLATGPDAVSGAADPNAATPAMPATPADPAAAAPPSPPATPDPASATPPADPAAPPPADPAAPPPAADPHLLDLSAGAPGADPGLMGLDDSVYIQPPPEGWLL